MISSFKTTNKLQSFNQMKNYSCSYFDQNLGSEQGKEIDNMYFSMIPFQIISKDQKDSIESAPMSNLDFNESNISNKANSFLDTSFDNNTVNSAEIKSKSNRFFSPHAVKILKKWFDENKNYPYPDDSTCLSLAIDANISTKQVRKWFANKRVRSNMCYKQIYRNKKHHSECSSNNYKEQNIEHINHNYTNSKEYLSSSLNYDNQFNLSNKPMQSGLENSEMNEKICYKSDNEKKKYCKDFCINYQYVSQICSMFNSIQNPVQFTSIQALLYTQSIRKMSENNQYKNDSADDHKSSDEYSLNYSTETSLNISTNSSEQQLSNASDVSSSNSNISNFERNLSQNRPLELTHKVKINFGNISDLIG